MTFIYIFPGSIGMDKEKTNPDITKEEKSAEDIALILSNPPHIKGGQTIKSIMWLVVLALVPATVNSILIYGLKAAIVILTAVISAVLAELVYQLIMKKPIAVGDGSAALTGLLLAMNIPPDAPFWVAGIGSIFSVIIVKQLFGGLGYNIFNPALAGRAFLMASWPVYMTTKWHRFTDTNVLSEGVANIGRIPQNAFDAITSATPLGALREAPKILSDLSASPQSLYDLIFSPHMYKTLLWGNIGGCIGETSALLLLLGALFLFYKRIITWHIPLSFIGTVAAFMLFYYSVKDVPGSNFINYFTLKMTLFHVLSGGIILGAFFMATDMVTSPVTHRGMIIFGIGCGLITSVIRIWGGYPEGVSYSILLMNAVVPLIDRYTKPRVFGTSLID